MALRAETIVTVLTVFIVSLHAEDIDKPPSFLKPLTKETRNVIDKRNITVLCEVEAKPAARYNWTFNNEPIAESSNYLVENGMLQIKQFRSENSGNYQCLAENTVNGNRAVAMSSVITIREAVLGSNWDQPVNYTTKTEGDYLQFKCVHPPECVPRPLYNWNQVSESDKSNPDRGDVKPTNRIYIDNAGTLHFIYLMTGDSSGELTYKCGLRNSVLDLIKLGSGRKLTVNSNPNGLVPVGTRNQFVTNPATFLRTKSAELECVFSGYPIPTITWMDRHGTTIGNTDKYTLSDYNNKLTINNLSEEDEGSYFCEGSNSKNTEKIEIFLNVTSGPIWEFSLSSQTKPEGSDAVFNCTARPAKTETPLAIPTWFINGEKIDVYNTDKNKLEFSDNFRVLTVKNLNKLTDIKCFQCNVSNEMGYELGNGCLNVIEPIVVTSRPEPVQTIRKGDVVDLTVKGTTHPGLFLQYRWQYNNNDLPPFVFNKAYINTSELTDEEFQELSGTYSVKLYDGYDSKTVETVVELDMPEKEGALNEAGASLWWIPIIAVLLVIAMIIIIIAYVISRAQDKGTYQLDKKERACDMDPEKDLADEGFQDLSRAPDENNQPSMKLVNPNFDMDDGFDDKPDGDEQSLEEYSGKDHDMGNFSEDGSFIGQYASSKKQSLMD